MSPRDLPPSIQETAQKILDNERDHQPIPDDVQQYLINYLQGHLEIHRMLAGIDEFRADWKEFYSEGIEDGRFRETMDACGAFTLAAEQHLRNLQAVDQWLDHVAPPGFETWNAHVKNVTADQSTWIRRIAVLAENLRSDLNCLLS